jgi:hypothetical protein
MSRSGVQNGDEGVLRQSPLKGSMVETGIRVLPSVALVVKRHLLHGFGPFNDRVLPFCLLGANKQKTDF